MNKHNVLKRMVALLIAVMLVFSLTIQIFAYDLLCYKVADKRATYTWGGAINTSTSSSTYKTFWRTAMSSWTSAVGYNISYSSSSSNTITIVNESSSTYYGYMQPHSTPNYVLTSFTAYVNIAHTGTNENVFKSVACHELGHTLGLDDTNNPNAVMGYNRNRNTIYTPQADDIEGVTDAYN
ncbi:MAG: matrixin family metalloprotease [Ruminococcaceae bacterium]|nr:matrixin family metalloprotease [Oscillospiraceae bacterium]